MNLSQIIKTLVSEIKLTEIQAKIFLHVVINGKMNTSKISNDLKISLDDATQNSKKLVELGGFIDMPNNEFEAMHPRFTAVNMYRKMCEREQKEFKKNLTVDNIGVALEVSYDDARTKYNK
ncbi:MAG: hypothetical protein MKZ78_03955 [Candidatus Nitrosopelagicus sp.]|nr:hypothetical protein [Candidatus Nitrosopelagicus sp.]